MLPPPYKRTENGIILKIRATPNAAHNRVDNVELRDDGQAVLRVRVRAIPDKGKANKAVIALLAKNLKIPKSAIELTAGSTARIKTLAIAGDPEKLSRALDTVFNGPKTQDQDPKSHPKVKSQGARP